MTKERLIQLRAQAEFATYVIHPGRRMPMPKDADAGDDMLELCAAVREQWDILQAALDDALSSPRDIDSVVEILEDALAKAEGR